MNNHLGVMERKLGRQNRLVIPAEFRNALHWPQCTTVFMEYYPEKAEIVIVADRAFATRTFTSCRIRTIDQLGRLSLPAEFRKLLKIDTGSSVQMICNLGAREIRLMMPA